MSKDAHNGPTGTGAVRSVEPGGPAPIGLRLKGRYRIVSELGTAAFGTVCLAEDEATGHRVAIRLLPRQLAGVGRAGQARRRTGQPIVAASTAHPALVRVVEFGEAENGQAFVAMELVEGRRLTEILSKGPLDVDGALRLALELGGSLETLHNVGLVHGALRPSNVMVREDGRVKLMDLELIGLRDAKIMKGIAAEPSAEYLSPEQIRGVPVTEKTDIYSFGVLLYEMFCGAPPFQAGTREAVLVKHLTGTPPPMRRQRRAIPAPVESVVSLALYKQADLRPPMHNVLNRLWAEASRPPTRWKRRAAMIGGAALATSVAGLVAWGLLAPRLSAPPVTQTAPVAAEQAPVSTPAKSTAPTTTSPSAHSSMPPRTKTGRRDQPQVSQATTDRARERPAESSDEEAYDPGAIIDWLLKRSSARDR